jgi:hypothetical protein
VLDEIEGLTEAILFVGIEEIEPNDLAEARAAAARQGFEVAHEVIAADPDGSRLRDTIEGAKVGGTVEVVLVPWVLCLGAKSTADLLNRLSSITSGGFRFVSLKHEELADTNLPYLVTILTLSEDQRKGGISRGNRKKAEEWKAEGRQVGRSPKCQPCGHGVVKRGGGAGHLRTPDGVGPCFVQNCGCVRYIPRNPKMMG